MNMIGAMRIEQAKKNAAELLDIVEQQEKIIEKLQNEVEVPASEKEAKLREELWAAKEDLNRGFAITEEQMKNVRKWQDKHRERNHKNYSYFTFTFVPTIFGTIGRCVCEECRRKRVRENPPQEGVENAEMQQADWEYTFQGIS